MKTCCFLALLFLANIAPAQTVLIPYRDGDKYGLSDAKGKIIVKPAYKSIAYIRDQYFRYSNEEIFTDTVKTFRGIEIKEYKIPVYGLFRENKILIPATPFQYFLIYKQCIVGSENPYHPEKCGLYNLAGKPLLTKIVKGLGVNDERDFGNMVNRSKTFSLITIFDRDQSRNPILSVAIYDHLKQSISSYLIRNARDYEFHKIRSGSSHAFYTYSDSTGNHAKYILYNPATGSFDIASMDKLKPKQREQIEGGSYLTDRNDEIMEIPVESPGNLREDVKNVISKPEITTTPDKTTPKSAGYYEQSNDSLFHAVDGKKIYVPLPAGNKATFILAGTRQTMPVILKKDDQFTLITANGIVSPSYDSLVYFGEHYIAGKKEGNSLHFGILDKTGNITVPLEYDSIPGQLKEIGFKRTGNTTTGFILQTKDEYFKKKTDPYNKPFARAIQVYKDGKTGLITTDNVVIIAAEYDWIGTNDTNYDNYKTGFITLKKNNLYGITFLKYNYRLLQYDLSHTVQPVFLHMPLYYIDNYYAVPGLRIYGLFNEKARFMGYAGKDGMLYFKD